MRVRRGPSPPTRVTGHKPPWYNRKGDYVPPPRRSRRKVRREIRRWLKCAKRKDS